MLRRFAVAAAIVVFGANCACFSVPSFGAETGKEVRLIVTVKAMPGKADELARIYTHFYDEDAKDPGCEQFETFRSLAHPDTIVVLELWKDQASLDKHSARTDKPQLADGIRVDLGTREDYQYNRTR